MLAGTTALFPPTLGTVFSPKLLLQVIRYCGFPNRIAAIYEQMDQSEQRLWHTLKRLNRFAFAVMVSLVDNAGGKECRWGGEQAVRLI
jgi:hypothetical protein